MARPVIMCIFYSLEFQIHVAYMIDTLYNTRKTLTDSHEVQQRVTATASAAAASVAGEAAFYSSTRNFSLTVGIPRFPAVFISKTKTIS